MNDKQRAKARRQSRKRRRRQQNALFRLAAVMISLMVVAAVVILASPRRGGTRIFDRSQSRREVEIAGPVITLEPEDTPDPLPEAESESARDSALQLTSASAEEIRDGDMQTAEALLPVQSADALLFPQSADDAGAFEYLPVYKRAETLEKVIAITVDDCFQIGNLRTIITTAYKQKGRLTLFPIGENLAKSGMKETLQGALKAGCEIENHTWSHERVFRLPEEQMAEQIWRQGEALNELLHMTYRQHFFRLMGGDGSSDQRTHNYLKQLGFYGIAEWAVSGSDSTLETIKKSLSPGLIYLFHTTDGDTEKLLQFIPYAVSQGYQLVTLNELLGFPENEISEYRETAMPMPQPYEEDYHVHKQGDYAWNIVRMQDKLRELGFLQMDGPSTGYYGEKTAQAIMDYQKSIGFSPTGIADVETQQKLLT